MDMISKTSSIKGQLVTEITIKTCISVEHQNDIFKICPGFSRPSNKSCIWRTRKKTSPYPAFEENKQEHHTYSKDKKYNAFTIECKNHNS